MKLVYATLTVLLLTASAFAQSGNSPQEQIERTIGNLFVANTNLQSQLQQAQAQIVELNRKLAEVDGKAKEPETKTEPKQ